MATDEGLIELISRLREASQTRHQLIPGSADHGRAVLFELAVERELRSAILADQPSGRPTKPNVAESVT